MSKEIMSDFMAESIISNLPAYVFGLLVAHVTNTIHIPCWVDEDEQYNRHIKKLIQTGQAANILGDVAKSVILDPNDIAFFLEQGTKVWYEDDGEVYTVFYQTDPTHVWVQELGKPLPRQSLTVID